MIGFEYKGSELYCDGLPVREAPLVAEHARSITPSYIYSHGKLNQNCLAMRAAFPKARVRYAVKASMSIKLLRIMREHGFGFDVVSHGELIRVKAAGASGSEVVFAGAAKDGYEIYEAVEMGATIVVERDAELPIIARAAEKYGKEVSVMLRLRPDVDAHTHHHLTTGKEESKFGMIRPFVDYLLRNWRHELVKIVGIHFHIGSQIESPECTALALDAALPIVDEFGLTELDIGGGFPVCYELGASAPPLGEFAAAIYAKLGSRSINLYIEPGRSLVADTAILLAGVMSQDYHSEGKCRTVACDTGMADLLRPMLYGAYHPIIPVNCNASRVRALTAVAGPFCESTDFLGKDRLDLPALERGDLLAVMFAGAYGYSMASNYNGNLRPPEIMVRDGQAELMTQRESAGHAMALDVI